MLQLLQESSNRTRKLLKSLNLQPFSYSQVSLRLRVKLQIGIYNLTQKANSFNAKIT